MRLQGIEKGGFYPIPVELIQLITDRLKPQNGGRIFDPCCGEGEALFRMAANLKMIPYGIELNEQRAIKAAESAESFDSHDFAWKESELADAETIVAGDSTRGIRFSRWGTQLMYLNPPYDWDKEDGRLEHTFLKTNRQRLQPEGIMVLVVPYYVLQMRQVAQYLESWFDEIEVFLFPEEQFKAFKQAVLIGKHREKSQLSTGSELIAKVSRPEGISEMISPTKYLNTLDQPVDKVWEVPEPIDLAKPFMMKSVIIDPAKELAELKSLELPEPFTQQSLTETQLKPVMPMKIGHLAGVIAAGHVNQTVKNETTGLPFLMKGRAFKEREQAGLPQEEETKDSIKTKTIVVERPQTAIATLESNGEIAYRNGPELASFLEEYSGELASAIAEKFPPAYNMQVPDWINEELKKLNRRVVPGTNIVGFLPAQRHTIAAAVSRFENERDTIIVGEMGVGKTVIGTAVAAITGKGKRNIVLCPPHLVKKWIREIKEVDSSAVVYEIQSIKDVDEFFKTPIRPGQTFYAVLKETTARSGSGWLHSYILGGQGVLQHPGSNKDSWEIVQGPDWIPDSVDKMKRVIEASYADGLNNPKLKLIKQRMRKGIQCPNCFETQVNKKGNVLLPSDLKRGRLKCLYCKGPMYQFSAKGNPKYPIATYINAKYKYHVLVADEVHQFKGADSDRGYAYQRLAQSSKKILALTGTIYGGKASSIFHLLYRTSPEMRESYDYKRGPKVWVERFGVNQEVITLTEPKNSRAGNPRSSTQVKEAPGGSPAMLPWLLNRSVFLSLKDAALSVLPEYQEIPIAVSMDEEMSAVYEKLQETVKKILTERLVKGDKSLLAGYLQALLSWPDSPWRAKAVMDPKDQTKTLAFVPAMDRQPGMSPKEVEITEKILEEKAAGRRVLLLCEQTATLDIQPQWKAFLESRGLKVAILKCSPKAREKWIGKQVAEGVDVIISHPKRVETGLDLLDFPTIIWMAVNYSVFTVLQASRRSWRIGQDKPVKVYFYIYEGTLQEEAIKIVAAKVAAALMVNGDTIPDDSIAELDEIASGDVVARLASVVTGDAEETKVDLSSLFQQMNKEAAESDAVIGMFEENSQTEYYDTAPSVTADTADTAPSVTADTADTAPSVTADTADTAPSDTADTADTAPGVTADTAPVPKSQFVGTQIGLLDMFTSEAKEIAEKAVSEAKQILVEQDKHEVSTEEQKIDPVVQFMNNWKNEPGYFTSHTSLGGKMGRERIESFIEGLLDGHGRTVWFLAEYIRLLSDGEGAMLPTEIALPKAIHLMSKSKFKEVGFYPPDEEDLTTRVEDFDPACWRVAKLITRHILHEEDAIWEANKSTEGLPELRLTKFVQWMNFIISEGQAKPEMIDSFWKNTINQLASIAEPLEPMETPDRSIWQEAVDKIFEEWELEN